MRLILVALFIVLCAGEVSAAGMETHTIDGYTCKIKSGAISTVFFYTEEFDLTVEKLSNKADGKWECSRTTYKRPIFSRAYSCYGSVQYEHSDTKKKILFKGGTSNYQFSWGAYGSRAGVCKGAVAHVKGLIEKAEKDVKLIK